MKISTLVKHAALIVVLSKIGYAMQPPPPPLGISQLRELIRRADLVVVGEIKEVKETEGPVSAGKEARINAVLKVEKILKGKHAGGDLVLEESYTKPGSMRTQYVAVAGEEHGKTITCERQGPAQYHGVYRKGARIIALLASVKGANAYRPLGSGTYNEHLCEFIMENGAVRTVNFSFAADLERYARSENEFTNLVAQLSERR